MIKGILLGLCLTAFVVSLFFIASSVSGSLQENIITGNVIGSSQLIGYSLISLIISFVLGFLTLIRILRK